MPVSLHSPHCSLWTDRSVDVDRDPWRILVVDDNAYSAEALSAALESDGFDTRFALSGVDALHAVDGWVPHIVVFQIIVPSLPKDARRRVALQHTQSLA